MLRNHLGRFWSQDVNETDQYLAARPDPLMSNIVCVVCPRGVFFLVVLGLLGPILFLIYMDDSALYYSDCGLYLFADDTNVFVFIGGKTVSDIAT